VIGVSKSPCSGGFPTWCAELRLILFVESVIFLLDSLGAECARSGLSGILKEREAIVCLFVPKAGLSVRLVLD